MPAEAESVPPNHSRSSSQNSLRPTLETDPQVPKHHSKYIPAGTASAANASGSLQTALSKVTRWGPSPRPGNSRARATSDRGLTFFAHNELHPPEQRRRSSQLDSST